MLRHVARALIGAVYVQQGIEVVRHPEGPARTAQPYVARLAGSTPVPDDPVLVVRAGGVAMVAGGVGLATNTAPRLVASLLTIVTAVMTFVRHPVRHLGVSGLRGPEGARLLADLGLLGGVVLAALDTEGRPGVTWRARHGSQRAVTSARRSARRAARDVRRQSRLVKLEARAARQDLSRRVTDTAGSIGGTIGQSINQTAAGVLPTGRGAAR